MLKVKGGAREVGVRAMNAKNRQLRRLRGEKSGYRLVFNLPGVRTKNGTDSLST